jgi:membrane protein DedA with SNARE-associated domain/rhodanese-related sulfurtransferase
MPIEQFLAEHLLVATFIALLLRQLGLPIPAFPVLIWAGAVGHADPPRLGAAFLLATLASTAGNLPWYWAGRRFGYRVLKLVCRVTLSPDSCVRKTEGAFGRRGAAMLLTARFLPGLEFVAPPLAGALHMPLPTFLAYDTAGSALRTAAGLGLGLLFRDQIDWLLDRLADLGANFLLVLGGVLAAYLAWRWLQRWRFLRSLTAARIGVRELRDMMDRGENPLVLDVRTATHRQLDGRQIPGAHPVDPEDAERTLAAIPRDREVVVYCACPNEATAAKVALQLHARGFRRVRPLAGGIDAWESEGLALEAIDGGDKRGQGGRDAAAPAT